MSRLRIICGSLGVVLIAFGLSAALAQSDAEPCTKSTVVWVFFTDKSPLDELDEMARLLGDFHPNALARRAIHRTRPGLIDERDWPVNENYVDAINERADRIRVVSRWLNAVSAVVSPDQRNTIECLPFVKNVEQVGGLSRARIDRAIDSATIDEDVIPPADFYGFSSTQLHQINLVELHDAGFTGEGIIVGVLDTGFKLTHEAFNHPSHPLQVIAQYDFVNDDPIAEPEPGDPVNQHEHGTYILGTLGAYWPDVLVGGAYDASFVLAKVDDVRSEFFEEEDWFVAGLEFVERNGADVATSSVVIYDHYTQEQLDGQTSVMTIGYNIAAENGLHCFQGAGNDGHDNDPQTSHLLPPADAFQVLTVGSVDLNGASAWFTSDGPSADGRTKPEIMTRGVDTYTVDPNVDDRIATASGASLATPVAASAAACIAQARPNWTVGQMRTTLTRTSDYFVENQTFDPLYIRGFGIINAFEAAALDLECLHLEVAPLIGGESALFVVEGAQPHSRVAIVWSTQPGSYARQYGSWCVDFDLNLNDGNITSRIVTIGRSDGAGTFSTETLVPHGHTGLTVFLQAAQNETCPDACMSNVVMRAIE